MNQIEEILSLINASEQHYEVIRDTPKQKKILLSQEDSQLLLIVCDAKQVDIDARRKAYNFHKYLYDNGFPCPKVLRNCEIITEGYFFSIMEYISGKHKYVLSPEECHNLGKLIGQMQCFGKEFGEESGRAFCHGDIKPENILFSDNQIHFIDFDNATSKDNNYDIISALHFFCLDESGAVDQEKANELLKGKNSISPFTEEEFNKLPEELAKASKVIRTVRDQTVSGNNLFTKKIVETRMAPNTSIATGTAF